MLTPIFRAMTAAVVVSLALPAMAQFGKNKITYEKFDWRVYHSPHFDIHYDASMEPFLDELISNAESAYLQLSRDLDHELRFRVPLIAYKTQGEFQQTNITLSELPDGVGAFAEPAQYRMVLPIDLPPDRLYELVSHELVHIFQYDLFFEGYLGRAIRSSPPTWLMEGMASYFADDEDNLDRMAIRDAVVNNILPPIQALDVLSFLTYRYGHAIFDYIETEHGKEGIRNFIFEYRKNLISNNVEKAIKEAFGYDVETFNRQFNRFLRRKYFPVLLEKKSPDDYGKEIGIRKANVYTFSPTASPSGELIAALSTPRLELDLIVLAAEDGEVTRNLTRGWTNKYRTLETSAFSAKRDLSWSPNGDTVAVLARQENQWPLLLYDAVRGKLTGRIVFDDIVECASPAFSPDGQLVAFEGNRKGVVDIFEVDLQTREIRNLTADDYFDANPWYSADGKTLVYNRRIGEHWKLFTVDLSDASRKTQLTFGAANDVQPAYSRDGKRIYFSSDRGEYGIYNIHMMDLASGAVAQYTDVVGGCFSPVELADRDGASYLAFTAFHGGTFRLYRMELKQPVARVEPEELAGETEAEPFELPLTLRADETSKGPYKLRWDVEAPYVAIGVTDDGTLLSDAAVEFSDLLGDQRIRIIASSVSDYANYNVSYLNLGRRLDWGAEVHDYRDYFLTRSSSGSINRDQTYRVTGGTTFAVYPVSRNSRVEGSVGLSEQSQDLVQFDPLDGLRFVSASDRYATAGLALVNDTARYQSFGPFQGKRFRLSTTYGAHLSGDFEGDIQEHRIDLRSYKQATRRSLLAHRVAAVINTGDRWSTYGFGGVNQLRGYEFRDFFGSNIAWTNLEFRFPLFDDLRFPVISLGDIRAFVFLDVGAAWLDDSLWYDPAIGNIRFDPTTGEPVEFKFWDSDESRLQDGRGSYGAGIQLPFIGGLNLNWVWSKRLDFTQIRCDTGGCVPESGASGGTRTDFYITVDF